MFDPISELAAIETKGLYRRRLVTDTPQSIWAQLGNERLLSFCSNDYLGLANHPQVVAALQAGARQYGVGAGASHLVSGHSRAHHALEEELAHYVGSERTLLFSTGYMANIGIVSALAGRHTPIVEDRLNHASLIDAARLARSPVKRFAHGDLAQLRATLTRLGRPALITTDAVFSMDGDIAALPAQAAIAREHGARVLVDEAHSFGVLGPNGAGALAHYDLKPGIPFIMMGTLGKAMGTFGAFVAAEAALIELLIQRARTYTYTTALPPAIAEATRASLRIAYAESWRRDRLALLVERFRRGAQALGLRLGPGNTPIQPVILGETQAAVRASAALRARGILIPAIRPPTVPASAARLRITFSALHEEDHVDRLLDALSQCDMAGG